MNFPLRPVDTISVDELEKVLSEFNKNGLEVYKHERYQNGYIIKLTETETIYCGHSGGKVQVQLKHFEDPTHIWDINNSDLLQKTLNQIIRTKLGEYPVTTNSGRLKKQEPLSNYQKISNLIGTANIKAVFDPYFENTSFTTLLDICSFGNCGIDAGLRILTSNKTIKGSIPRLTKNGVDSFFSQIQLSGELRILNSKDEHRRFLLLSNGKSLIIGNSLNSLHKNEVIHTENGFEDLKFFDDNWKESEEIK